MLPRHPASSSRLRLRPRCRRCPRTRFPRRCPDTRSPPPRRSIAPALDSTPSTLAPATPTDATSTYAAASTPTDSAPLRRTQHRPTPPPPSVAASHYGRNSSNSPMTSVHKDKLEREFHAFSGERLIW